MGKRRSRIPPRFSAPANEKKKSKIRAGRLIRGLIIVSLTSVTYFIYFLSLMDYSDISGSYHPIADALGYLDANQKQVQVIEEKLKETHIGKNSKIPGAKQIGKQIENNPKINEDKQAEKTMDDEENQMKKIMVKVGGEDIEIPSAQTLLTSKPPFEDSDVITLFPADSKEKLLIKAPNTVVTGYFRVKSKYHSSEYDGWMRNMLSLQDAMVIFTEPDLVDQIKELRSHAVNRTIIVPVTMDDLPIGRLYSETFWKDQLDRDPEQRIHRSYQLFWIWLSKSWCVTQAIRLNVFDSDLFVWSDIGCFRNKKYNSKTLVLHRENVPDHEMLQMAHHVPNPPSEVLFNDKYKKPANFYHSGSQFVGYKDAWLTFHKYFLETIDRFLKKNMIIVEDQAVLQSVCLSHPEICAYVPFKLVNDNHYFGLRHVLHYGGNLEYWRYKPNIGSR